MSQAKVAVIGGSGLYRMEGLEGVHRVEPETPFGRPSGPITLGEMGGVKVAFLPRHGEGHRISPSEIPARANIYALKVLGVERVVAVSAVGSLHEEVHPLDMVVPHQLIDRTKGRPSTFFEGGIVAHISFADPFCPHLSQALVQAAREVGARVHPQGTYLVMEGPPFSTRAESALYRSWGATIIGMTALPEAKLAREAEMCYAMLACVTDYDVWHETEAPVSVELVVENLKRNVARAREVLRLLIPRLVGERPCPCPQALRNAIVTRPDVIPRETRERLAPIIGKYIPS